jgi:cytochrome c
MKKFAIMAALLSLAACGSKPEESAPAEPSTTPAAPAETAAATDGPPAAFAQCSVCHKVEKDAPSGVGPNLHGIVGKKAASVAGFNYSPALKDWGQTWTEASLDKYIESPRGFIAGGRMAYAGQPDAAKRAEIIAWLKKNG